MCVAQTAAGPLLRRIFVPKLALRHFATTYPGKVSQTPSSLAKLVLTNSSPENRPFCNYFSCIAIFRDHTGGSPAARIRLSSLSYMYQKLCARIALAAACGQRLALFGSSLTFVALRRSWRISGCDNGDGDVLGSTNLSGTNRSSFEQDGH